MPRSALIVTSPAAAGVARDDRTSQASSVDRADPLHPLSSGAGLRVGRTGAGCPDLGRRSRTGLASALSGDAPTPQSEVSPQARVRARSKPAELGVGSGSRTSELGDCLTEHRIEREIEPAQLASE